MDNFLVGKKVNDVKLSDDNISILFKCDDGDHIASCYADCCSYTWIENVELPALGFPFTVLSVEDLKLPDSQWLDDYDYLQYYGLKLKTDKGDFVLDYRNSSNGYYGGWLNWPDSDYRYGGVYGQNISTEVWKNIE